MDIAEITNLEIIRMILSLIYHLFDHGGISTGRSPVSSLLENAMALLDISDKEREYAIREVFKSSSESLLSEARDRISGLIKIPPSHISYDDFDKISNEDLAFILLVLLQKFMKQNFVAGGLPYKKREQDYCGLAINLFMASRGVSELASIPLENLGRVVGEARDRIAEKRSMDA